MSQKAKSPRHVRYGFDAAGNENAEQQPIFREIFVLFLIYTTASERGVRRWRTG